MTLPASALSFLLRRALFLAVVLTACSVQLFTVVSEAFAMSDTAPDPIDCVFDSDPGVKSPNIRIIVSRTPLTGPIKHVCLLYGTERIPKNEVINDIEAAKKGLKSGFIYFVCHPQSTAQVHVVKPPPEKQPYLRTNKTETKKDDLGSLPACDLN